MGTMPRTLLGVVLLWLLGTCLGQTTGEGTADSLMAAAAESDASSVPRRVRAPATK